MKKRIPQLLLIVSLVLVLLGSVLAQTFHTSMYTVDIERIKFETDKGILSGLLYMPKGASESDPRPTVVVTHGYLNSAEMQDLNAIELSRRGYVVLALDMYDHGHSAGNAENTGAFFSFWPSAQYDAACYMYEQPYVLKDEAGNGIIGVTGHSMGGFSSSMAVFMDEQAFAATGIRKIAASLTLGSDYQWASYLGLTPEVAAANHGGRTMGKLAAQYDEFFFNPDGNAGGTVIKKDFVSTTAGKTFLEQEAPEAGVWYTAASDGGKRIVYQPAETHPWNHTSTVSCGHVIDFYTEAFSAYNANLNNLPANDQIWMYKELFELVALVGLMLAVVPVIMLIVKLPFFKKAVTGPVAPLPSVSGATSKLGTFALLLIFILLPGLLFPALMDKNMSGEIMGIIGDLGVIFAIAGLAAVVVGLKDNKKIAFAGIAAAILGGSLKLFVTIPSYGAGWNAPSVNQIAYWTLICAIVSGLVLALVYIASKSRQDGVSIANYGLKACPIAIVASLATALVGVIAVYAVVFVIDAIFVTDFRIWVFAFKTFEFSITPDILQYLPTFLMYYIISSASIMINTNTEKLQGWKGYALAIALNCGGIVVYLIRQYGTLFATGTAAYPTQALSSILLVAMVPTLAIAACFSRALYKRTGNISTAAFFNGILMTVMTLANTCVYGQV